MTYFRCNTSIFVQSNTVLVIYYQNVPTVTYCDICLITETFGKECSIGKNLRYSFLTSRIHVVAEVATFLLKDYTKTCGFATAYLAHTNMT